MPATVLHVNFTLMASGMCPKLVPAMAFESIWVSDEMQLSTTWQGSPHSAFSWVTFSDGFHSHVPTVVLRQLGLMPRFSRVVSATCPAAALHVILCPTSRGYQGCAHSSPCSSHQQVLQQPGASCSSPRLFHLGGIRDVSKGLFQLWLSSHVPAMALVHLDPRSVSSEVCECANQVPPLVPHINLRLILGRLEVFWPLTLLRRLCSLCFDRRFHLSRSVNHSAQFPYCCASLSVFSTISLTSASKELSMSGHASFLPGRFLYHTSMASETCPKPYSSFDFSAVFQQWPFESMQISMFFAVCECANQVPHSFATLASMASSRQT